MKKKIPFTKQIHFKTQIAEVTDIEITHSLKIKEDNMIEGDIIVDGTYKIHEASQLEELFHYNLPFTIDVDNKYNIEDANIIISDFYFEIINEEDLKVNVELEINNVVEKEEELVREDSYEIPIEIEEVKTKIEMPSTNDTYDYNFDTEDNDDYSNEDTFSPSITTETNDYKFPPFNDNSSLLEIETEDDDKPIIKQNNTGYTSIFDTISNEETFVTYYVYIMRENDTVEAILDKYKITRDDILQYNDLENLKIGSKIIIPCHNE